ncbi:MAG: hypothetical protein ABII64_02635 [Elusimicrobiota bacterium]
MKKKMGIQIAHLVNTDSTTAVFEEVKYNFIQFYTFRDFEPVRKAFYDFNLLFEGKFPGYRACNTKYHDKIHTTDALLAISRLIDGYNLTNRNKFTTQKVKVALIATIFHDTGYIQKITDREGTGAKYTLNHVERSIEFIQRYFKSHGFTRKDFITAMNMVHCTGLSVNLKELKFQDKTEEILGYMLGTADILGQMASRTYLERLLYLYREFKEGHVQGYKSEIDLLKKTIVFYESTKIRLKKTLKDVHKFTLPHFKARYKISQDLYTEAISRQIYYLKEILAYENVSLKDKLRRQVL